MKSITAMWTVWGTVQMMPLQLHPIFCDPRPQGCEEDEWEWESNDAMRNTLLGPHGACIVSAISAYYLLEGRSSKLVADASLVLSSPSLMTSSASLLGSVSEHGNGNSADLAWDDSHILLKLQEVGVMYHGADKEKKEDNEEDCKDGTCIHKFEHEFRTFKPFLMHMGQWAVQSGLVGASLLQGCMAHLSRRVHASACKDPYKSGLPTKKNKTI